MLTEMADRPVERVRAGLAEEIKAHIPERLHAHRRGLDTINIVIDLRVGKLAAAAAIIITMILLANIHGLYRDGKMLTRYFMGGSSQSDILTGKTKYELLVKSGEDVVLYSDIDTQDSNAVRMHWKVPQHKYKVLFRDMREAEVGADEFIRLQTEDSNAVRMYWKVSQDRYKVVFGDMREAKVSADELIRLQAQMLQKKVR
jgi:hypothetical protein